MIDCDWTLITSAVGTVIATTGFVYAIIRNMKTDINAHIDKLDKRMDTFETRMISFETRMTSIEERLFWVATGKKLEDAILEERLKREPKTNP